MAPLPGNGDRRLGRLLPADEQDLCVRRRPARRGDRLDHTQIYDIAVEHLVDGCDHARAAQPAWRRGYNPGNGKIYLNGGYETSPPSTPSRPRPGSTTRSRTPSPPRRRPEHAGRHRLRGRQRPPDHVRWSHEPGRDSRPDLGLRHRHRHVVAAGEPARCAKNVPAGVVARQALLDRRGHLRAPPFDGTNDVESFDPAANTWSPEPTLIAASLVPRRHCRREHPLRGRRPRRRRDLPLHRGEAGAERPAAAATSATASAAATAATATTASAATATTATTASAATATSAASTTGSSATSASGPLSCPESARAASRRREDEDPEGALLGRQRATRSLAPFAARPCRQPVTAARHDQAPELPGQAGGRSRLGKPTPTAQRAVLRGGPLS